MTVIQKCLRFTEDLEVSDLVLHNLICACMYFLIALCIYMTKLVVKQRKEEINSKPKFKSVNRAFHK